MKYPRNNYDDLFKAISNACKSVVIPVGSYGRKCEKCGDLDVCIKISSEYSGSDVFKDLLNAGFKMKRFKENDGGEIWLNNQMCHVIFFTDTDYILKITRFLEGKHNAYNLWHELYVLGYRINADEFRIFDKDKNEIFITSFDQLESLLSKPIPYRDLIIETLNNYKLN